jgi:ABC-type bacteriocin/lantibiotic exporter with double-glycine peptidase domain
MVSPIYLQTDERWKDETIGGSGERIRSVGCMLCCVAMSLTYHGIHIDPADLNTHLKQTDGYTDRGWVIWGAVTALSDDIQIDIPQKPTHKKIDEALKEKTPVIAKILLKGYIPHWVLIVGKHTGQYLVLDPLGNGKIVNVLSHFNSDIYAIRIISFVTKEQEKTYMFRHCSQEYQRLALKAVEEHQAHSATHY